MDFDLSKENIQPLRGGRNVSQLEVALQAQTNQEYQRELQHQREEFENSIRNYAGNDPLEIWYSYVSWVEQSYPKHGHEGNLVNLLELCLSKFEHDKRYTNDRRFCRLWIKYIDLQKNPFELFHMMYARGLCKGCADLYRAWAYYYEAASDFQNANNVFECGKREIAQPYEDLESAHKNLIMAAGQHMLYGTDERRLVEKRQALTSLHTYKPGRVGSVRIPANSGAGVLPGTMPSRPTSNAVISIYEDRGEETKGAEAAPTSILTAAKRQDVPKENTLKPGPWTTVPVKKRLTVQRSTPSFTVHEDNGDSTNRAFPPQTLEGYSDWVVSLCIPEPSDGILCMYPKRQVYADICTEYSPEELRALRYNSKKRKVLVESDDEVFNEPVIDENMPMEQAAIEIIDGPDLIPRNSVINNETFGALDQKPNSFSGLAGAAKKSPSRFGPSPARPVTQQQQQQVISLIDDDDEEEGQEGDNTLDLWKASPIQVVPKSAPKFSIYEQSNLGPQEHIEPKGSAMKTPFKDLNAEELCETGSSGGMEIAAAAPVDSAKRLPLFDEDSSPALFGCKTKDDGTTFADLSCNTQMFNFNLNAMQVSTPQNKQQNQNVNVCADDIRTRKQLFSETQKTEDEGGNNKALSTILEETKSYGSSGSCSSGTTTKSLTANNKHNNMATISEEHNSYLMQNLLANAALRTSLLGDLMDFNPPQPNLVTTTTSPAPTTPSPMITSLPSSPIDEIPRPVSVSPINFVPSDPFRPALISQLLQKVDFPGPHTRGYYVIHNTPRLAVRKEAINVGFDKYLIEKQLGKGTYGVVFRGEDVRTGNTVALKSQRPANKWEFYICRELQSRLADHPLRDRFMDVRIGYFSDQASVLISEFMRCGSLLDVANMVKQKTGRSMKESLCIHFCIEMLKVVQAMHSVKIIHADIKPDNFLVQLLPDRVALQLIDFGCSIDMTLFPPGTSFTRKVTTENFICCEMREGRRWNYHTDMYCVAATAHVLLFEKYMQTQKKDGHWSITHRLPRYLRLDLWNSFFCTLLNQQNEVADSSSLQCLLADSLKSKYDDYQNELRFLLNILQNR